VPDFSRLMREAPMTLTLISLNLLAYAGQMATANGLDVLGLLYGPAVADGQWWRVITSAFLHGSLIHIGFNLFLLYQLGMQLERGLGTRRFLLMYFGSLFGAALAVMLFAWDQPTLGASGAVLGLAGSLGLALHERGVSPQNSPLFVLVMLNLALPLLMPGISFWGHFGGVLAGVLMGYLLIWIPARSRRVNRATLQPLSLAIVVLLGALSVLAGQLGISWHS
jgi:membrane associated rhomboid family serine protease